MTALNELHRQTMRQEGVSEEWFGFTGIQNGGRWVVGSGNGGLYSMDRSTAGVSGRNPGQSVRKLCLSLLNLRLITTM